MSQLTGAERAFLRRLRQAAPQPAELARRLRAPLSTLTPWYNDTGLPSASYMLRLPGVLRVDARWLFTGKGHPADRGGDFEAGVRHERTRVLRAIENGDG